MTSVLVRWPWLALYLVSNIVAAWVMYDTGLLIGDLAGLPLYSGLALAWALLLVLGSYLFILRPGFDFLCRIRVRPMQLRAEPGAGGNRLGGVLLVLQVAYFAFNSYFGVNVAGSGRTEGVPFAIFWVFMPVDALMVVYYGYHRDSRLFFPNAAVWVVSNLARGWSGIFFFILFLEWCRAARSGRLRLKWIIMLGVGVLLSYPLLINLKWIIRASAQTGFGLEQVGQGFAALFAAEDYGTLIWNGVLQIVARFQTVANVVETMRLSDLLQSEFDAGRFTPFWLEGLHGVVYDRLFHGDRSIPIGVAFTEYAGIGQGLDLGTWNTNIGFIGWSFIAPGFFPFYLLYTVLLAYVSVFLVKKIGMTAQAGDMLWFTWLVYLLPPWHGAFVGFLYALSLFLVMTFVLAPRSPALAAPCLQER